MMCVFSFSRFLIYSTNTSFNLEIRTDGQTDTGAPGVPNPDPPNQINEKTVEKHIQLQLAWQVQLTQQRQPQRGRISIPTVYAVKSTLPTENYGDR